jgi:hypothetical protein
MMFTAPILVLALAGQAPSVPATAPGEPSPQVEPAQQPPADQVDAPDATATPATDPATDPSTDPAADPAAGQAAGQAPGKPPSKRDLKEPPTPPHTGIRALFGNLLEDFKHLPSHQNFLILGGGGLLAWGVHPADEPVNKSMVENFDKWNTFFAPGKYIGDTPEQVAGAIITYAYGRIRDQPKVSHFGMDLLQAQIMAEVLFQPIKYATQRLRPDGSDHLSFPSGHASITFATATVIERHLGWRKSILAYVIASYVAASRLHDDKHWLSDVVFGAAVGTIAGRTVVHHASDYWAVAPVKVPGGVAVMVTRTASNN